MGMFVQLGKLAEKELDVSLPLDTIIEEAFLSTPLSRSSTLYINVIILLDSAG